MNKKRIAYWAPIISGAGVGSCLIYCMFWWMPMNMTWRDPDCSLICHTFCSTMNRNIAVLGLIISAFSILAGLLSSKSKKTSMWLNILVFVPLFPSGLLNLAAVWVNRTSEKI